MHDTRKEAEDRLFSAQTAAERQATMYTPDKPIDRPQYIAKNVLNMLGAIAEVSDVDSDNDYSATRREASERDLYHAIEMLRDIRGNDEITILRKIAFGIRVYHDWQEYETTEGFYHF